MLAARIENPTTTFKPPADWDVEDNGHCGELAIRVERESGLLWMRSAWEAEPDEVLHLMAGGKVILGVSGTGHPVVSLSVQPADEFMRRASLVREEIDPKGTLCVSVETIFPPPPGGTTANRARCTVAVGAGGQPRATMVAMAQIERIAADRGWTP